MNMEKFDNDLEIVFKKLIDRYGVMVERELKKLLIKLSELYRQKLVKINHSIMEMICAAYLVLRGYSVDVERMLSDLLVCDVYGVKGEGVVIVEVETGFTPPDHALDPLMYLQARIVSKVARYSLFANKFCLATPRHNILEIPAELLKPPRFREEQELNKLKILCDKYYSNPPITYDELKRCRLHSVFILNIDDFEVNELSPDQYFQKFLSIT
ncbi:MAG: hypothetical protein QXI52_05925 [Nitrososphaerota archaeon]